MSKSINFASDQMASSMGGGLKAIIAEVYRFLIGVLKAVPTILEGSRLDVLMLPLRIVLGVLAHEFLYNNPTINGALLAARILHMIALRVGSLLPKWIRHFLIHAPSAVPFVFTPDLLRLGLLVLLLKFLTQGLLDISSYLLVAAAHDNEIIKISAHLTT
jgi:hypothetical protein